VERLPELVMVFDLGSAAVDKGQLAQTTTVMYLCMYMYRTLM
jgi:hypothetical protein